MREADRYKVSLRAAAAIANATLKDHAKEFKISDINSYLIDASKIQRERARVGKLSENERESGTYLIMLLYIFSTDLEIVGTFVLAKTTFVLAETTTSKDNLLYLLSLISSYKGASIS